MAHLLPTSFVDGERSYDNTDNDAPGSDFRVGVNGGGRLPSMRAQKPSLFHKIQNHKSILALLISDSKIYAGTQNGDLLVGHTCDTSRAQPRCLHDKGVVLGNVRASIQCPRAQRQRPLSLFVGRRKASIFERRRCYCECTMAQPQGPKTTEKNRSGARARTAAFTRSTLATMLVMSSPLSTLQNCRPSI